MQAKAIEQQVHTITIEHVNAIIEKAIARQASDIHLEPQETMLRVRYRIDGILYDQESIPAHMMSQVISRLKVIARIDITEKRLPQDGKFQLMHKKNLIDLRVSTFPSLCGEKLVVRILDQSKNAISVNELGFSGDMLTVFNGLLTASSGFMLVVGPTGSGKTTTLYAALSSLNSTQKNIITLEDPVEYTIPGITQGQINHDVGFSFETGIRALLRQDPNIIMIGEIRDKQTACMAIEASLTGHLVLSTVHTNDALQVLMRLMDMGIEPFLLHAALSGIVAQRLARKICIHCKVRYEPTDQELLLLRAWSQNIPVLFKGTGCKECHTIGYSGRIGIFELLSITPAIRNHLLHYSSFEDLSGQIKKSGFKTMMEDGFEKVKAGIISLPELVRVLS